MMCIDVYAEMWLTLQMHSPMLYNWWQNPGLQRTAMV